MFRKTPQQQEESVVFEKEQAQGINFNAAHLISELFSTSIGPFGSTKLLEEGNGNLTLTKDGGNLVNRLQFVHPTALFLGRAGKAQERFYKDGVSRLISLIDGILKQSEYKIDDGSHPRTIVKGLEIAREIALKNLDEIAIKLNPTRTVLRDVARSACKTKHAQDFSDQCVDAVLCVKNDEKPIDLDLIEVLRIKNASQGVRLVRGVVVDQGYRHEMMPKKMKDVRILCMNISLELEPSAYATFAPVADADQKERLMIAERKFVDDKVKAIIELKDACKCDFLVVNGKGIDNASLDILSRANICALRRVSQKTINRFIHACGCRVVNCVDDLTPGILGFAGQVTEENYKGNKYVYVDEVKEPKSVSLVVGGVNEQVANLITEAVKDGLRAVKQALEDKRLLPGGGATEICLSQAINDEKANVEPMQRVGLDVFAEALLDIPRTLCKTSGHEAYEIVPEMQNLWADGERSGLDCDTGEIVDPVDFGVYDNYCVTRAIINSAPIVATQLLLVDQIIEVTSRHETPKEKTK